MDEKTLPRYDTFLGSPEEPITVSLLLPRPGEHEFKWVVAETIGKEYGHFGFRIHPKALPVNIHVYGKRELIEHLAKSGKLVRCGLELVAKRTSSDREFIFVNLYLTKPWLLETHELKVIGTSPDPTKRPWFVYTTKDMNGIGVSVKPIG
jgi:hypothetical protein